MPAIAPSGFAGLAAAVWLAPLLWVDELQPGAIGRAIGA
jgi:hypothetical protein